MPNLDGPTMTRLLKRSNPALKMLLVSGVASAGAVSAAREVAGIHTSVLGKPFIAEALLIRVDELLHPRGSATAP
jgi:hypothetical protein